MTAPIIAVTDTAVANETAERELAEEFSATYRTMTDGSTTISACVDGAAVLFTNFHPITHRELAALAPRAVVIRYGVGVDNVDLDAAQRLGVRVANVPDYGSNVVADHTVLLIGTLQRRIRELSDRLRRGEHVTPAEFGSIRSLEATTVGLVGAGRIARLTAQRLQGFGCTVIASDPYVDAAELAAIGVEHVELDVLLRRSHVVSVHAPLTPATEGLLGDPELAAMRPGAILVNTSRGGLVDTGALIRALESGEVAGAALDVTDPEPLPTDSPLRHRDDVILTPHVAFYSNESMIRLQELAVAEGRRALLGEGLRSPVLA
ncbi:C-terminal binding protein [Ruania alba]|uniref:D-3-phosphoglycerate dehydrogenase n=1 Tax=Ruania alba TaxID=648782 RepID=A0A1H5MDM6_9MICO|nr:C-terminal binding protein [Ruania alba]SEE87579.1 D-3-phosphoglycerate dehydrogenase [Ruania alba]